MADLHLWLVDLLASNSEVASAFRALSPDEADRARRFHFERDARRYTIAHAALRSILARYLSMPPDELVFQTNTYGKPSLAMRDGTTCLDLAFNLSHAGELALIGLGRGRQIGVDIEQVRAEFAGGQIAEQFFSPAEVEALASLPAENRTLAFFRCWTRKEAFVKARGEGLSVPLDSFDVTLRPEEPPMLLRVASQPAEASRWSMVEVPVDAEAKYQAAAVVDEKMPAVCAWLFLRNN